MVDLDGGFGWRIWKAHLMKESEDGSGGGFYDGSAFDVCCLWVDMISGAFRCCLVLCDWISLFDLDS